LTVGEKAAVITLPGVGQNLQTHFLKYLLLVCILIGVGSKSRKQLHKVASLILTKFVVRPEGIVECEIPKFLFVIFIVKTSGRSDHINTKFAIKGDFSLIEGPDSDTDFNTHV
jgi:hypothetical protein